MSKLFKNLSNLMAFSLTEVLTIFIVVGVLTAIALPIYNDSLAAARLCEADANLGSIRTELRIYSNEHGRYPIMNPPGYVVGADWNKYGSGEIAGKYFSDSSYTYHSSNGENFTITCEAGITLVSDRTIDHAGNLTGGL